MTAPFPRVEPAHVAGFPASGVYALLATSPAGLTETEAQQRSQLYGPNLIQKGSGKALWRKFLANFTHLMAILLWLGGVVGFVAQMPELGIAIWAVNIINGVFSFWQEFKAEQATEALRKLLPAYARVLRNAQEEHVLVEALVPGDVILVAEGERISADARLVEENELRVDQSTLSGESHPARKTSEAVLQEDLNQAQLPNLIYAGTMVIAGTGRAVVFATGMQTAFGLVARLTQTVGEELSPLQKELGRVTRTITIQAVVLGTIFFLLAIYLAGVDLAESFIFAMGMIVAFVPEGLLPTVTLALAMSVQHMARRHALVKRLSAVETLGCTTVICTDKTGTLTENAMTVTSIWLPCGRAAVTGAGYAPLGAIIWESWPGTAPPAAAADLNSDLLLLLRAAALCNNARLLPPDGEKANWEILGDPTEAALRVAAVKAGIDLAAEERQKPRIRELPFESRRKRMSTVHAADGGQILYLKGAPREVLALCTQVRQGGRALPLDAALQARIVAANDEYAAAGLRVLAVAMRCLPVPATASTAETYLPELIERDLTLLGLLALMDPPRAEVAEAVQQCHSAGIRIIMITGDYGLTAESIARRIGILRTARPQVITGVDLDILDDAALQELLRSEVIFARVAPEHKLRVVTALQQMGEIVAVTGDGVNDAPALKKADIGVAMGMAGTDVAKEAADMVLTDDNFASIVHAVEAGRAVYENIRRFMLYIITSNMPEAVPFLATLLSRGLIPLPLTVMQVLAIDLGTDMMPAIGLGAEPPEPGIMQRRPRSQSAPLLTVGLLAKALLWYGMFESVASMSAYFYLNWSHGWPGVPLAPAGTELYRIATTMTLATVVATQIGAVLARRTERSSILQVGFASNRLILWGILVELLLLFTIVYIWFLQPLFNTAPLGLQEWIYVFAWTPLILVVDEVSKAIMRWRHSGLHHGAPLGGGVR